MVYSHYGGIQKEKRSKLTYALIALVLAVALASFVTIQSVFAANTVYYQGFEANTDGWNDSASVPPWYGTVERVPSGSNGIGSALGDFHALMSGDEDSGPFSRFDGYRSVWPGNWEAEVDVYLDPAWAAGSGFDYSVAANGSDGAHQRDFIFHIAKDTSSGKLYVAGSNNTNFNVREDLDSLTNKYEVTEAGWYTLQHAFRNDSGVLAVDLNLLDSNGTVLFTETRTTPVDTIPAEVGGNRYSWFTVINIANGLAVDSHELKINIPSPTSKDQCKNNGWKTFNNPTYKNQGDCVSAVASNGKAKGNPPY
jgi:hypothetical protein